MHSDQIVSWHSISEMNYRQPMLALQETERVERERGGGGVGWGGCVEERTLTQPWPCARILPAQGKIGTTNRRFGRDDRAKCDCRGCTNKLRTLTPRCEVHRSGGECAEKRRQQNNGRWAYTHAQLSDRVSDRKRVQTRAEGKKREGRRETNKRSRDQVV